MIVARTAEVGRVLDLGIDHEGPRTVVWTHLKRDADGTRAHIAAFHRASRVSDFLIDNRPLLAHLTRGGAQPQASIRLDRDVFGSLELKLDPPRVSAGLDDEVVLEPAGRPLAPFPSCVVVDNVDPGVDIIEPYPRKVRNIPAPPVGVVSDVVVAAARQTTHTSAHATWVGPGNSEPHGLVWLSHTPP